MTKREQYRWAYHKARQFAQANLPWWKRWFWSRRQAKAWIEKTGPITRLTCHLTKEFDKFLRKAS